MRTVFRWLLRGFVALGVLVLGALLLVYYFASRSIPDYNADYTVAGIEGPVEIVRDTNNVPHIFADDARDVYFGLGFSHAQDRLWQMTMLRRTAQGRLSELFGSATLDIDEFIRRLDFAELSRRSYEFQTEEVQSSLDAYAAGVNAWLNIVQRDALGRGAPEFFLFSPEIEPWTPADSLSIMRVMALQLSGHLRNEVSRARVSLAVGPERLRDIMPDAPGSGSMEMPEFADLFPNLDFRTARSTVPHWADPVRPLGFAGASNAWAAGPSRSATGASILANDPHLGLSSPSIWMLARMDFPDGGVIGGTIPGIPVILSGRSDDFAWGLTTAYLDDVDVYIEQLNPENPDEYLTPEGYKPFQTRDVVVRTSDGAPKTLTLRWTE
ncbi:MAG: penicillin acylase family protein, partial [Pseudomonadota bacterium]